ncbi:hypothetical protein PRIPAC_88974 [Pristionchus pacificus]|uniref:Uncharacterized protein n=1 Tax=Pristionchus pacificus TaxID=54126 RepID=A0A2A6B5T5_PRIPA|nr:hypothetical protein PRIPAC_88974 [Pristionchus pacificus]|eukprot:PDM61237.1 hypothetical protein PRIPAC_50679 [Pristionchus pacificus]
MEGLFWKEGNAARMKSSQDCANLSDAERFRHRRLLVIVKAKFFSDSVEQKIKASGEACVLVAQGTITCSADSTQINSRDFHFYCKTKAGNHTPFANWSGDVKQCRDFYAIPWTAVT